MTLAASNSPWADAVLPISQSRNDLYAQAECVCPSPLFIGSDVEHIMKHKIRIVGYDDSNFFDRVNMEPREGACRCGRRYRYQWWRDGVAFAFLASADTHAERCDVEQAQPVRVGSATAKPGRTMTIAQLARDSAE